MRLFIAEKPSLGREIAKALGGGMEKQGYIEISNGQDIVTWEFGHLLQNFEPEDYDEKYRLRRMEDLPIIPNKWQKKIVKGNEKQYKTIESLVAQANLIVNAGDPDREGQLLVDELLEQLGNKKPVQRVLVNALDEKSIKQALTNLRDNQEFAGMRDAARARSYADWLVGMNYSRAFSVPAKQAGYAKGAHIGRVKTPTMAMVVRREDEIKNFKSVQYYQVQADWEYEGENIRSLWQPDENTSGLDLEDRLVDKSVAEAVLVKIQQSTSPAAVAKIEEKEKQEQQHLPYSLSALQVEAGKRFGYDPKTVLQTMQQLYEKKLTTYPRSDCDYLPENQYGEAAQVLANLQKVDERLAGICAQADTSIKSRAWNDKKISAHHAIVPTCELCNFSQLTEQEQNMYFMVAQAYIAQFYPVHIYQAIKIWIVSEGEKFKATGKVIKQIGWKAIYGHDAESDKDEDRPLPAITEGETVLFQSGKILDKQTKPPKRFTPATLLEAMKEVHKFVKDKSLQSRLKSVHGIGTEATRANIIDELISANFLRVEKKQLLPTEAARMLVDILPDTLTWPDTTALWEDELEDVQEGKLTIEAFLASKTESITRGVDAARYVTIEPAKEAVKCPQCGKVLVLRDGKNGKFWGCSGYPTCQVHFPNKNGKPDMEDHTQECPVCHVGHIRRIKGKYGYFWGCNNGNCKKNFRDDRGKPVVDTDEVKCPSCGRPMRRRKGKKGYFWGCSGYPDCKQTLEDRDGKPVQK